MCRNCRQAIGNQLHGVADSYSCTFSSVIYCYYSAQLVHKNTREIIRRDRNHPSVLMWEPILNETSYPLDFALEALKITKDEYPYEGRPVAAADVHSAGVAEHYDVVYGWPGDDEKPGRPGSA